MADYKYGPNLARSNPNALSGNIIQAKIPVIRPTVDVDPNVAPSTVDINFTKAGAGPYDYQIVAGAAGDDTPKNVWWFVAIDGTGADACPQTVDAASAELDTRSGIDATVSFAAATMYALVETTEGNLTFLTLS